MGNAEKSSIAFSEHATHYAAMFTRCAHVAVYALLLSLISSSVFIVAPASAQATGLGSQIVCMVFTELNTIGTPIPFLEAEGCPDESTLIPQCSDGINNDTDEFTDYPNDPGCESATDTTESPNPVVPPPPPVLPSQCMDGIDNDGDGKTDWHLLSLNGDPGCSSPLDENESDDPPPPPAACADGIDNDADQLTDYPADPGCASATDTDETNVPPPPPPAACADGVDNDEDTLTDFPADPGCADAADTDETNTTTPPPGGGGGGGGGSGGSGGSGGGGGSSGGPVLGGGILQTTGQVLGVATQSQPVQCEPYLKSFIRRGTANNADDVGRLQQFLNQFESATLEVTRVYDAPTFAAVLVFQAKHLGDVLSPWGINAPTGYVYLTTKKKINEIYCNATYALSTEELNEIARIRGAVLGAGTVAPVPVPKTTKVEKAAAPSADTPTSTVETGAEPTERRSILDRVRSVFDRLFSR